MTVDEQLRKLAAGPLINPLKINADPANLNEGKPLPAPRAPKQPHEPRPGDLTPAQIREKKEKALAQKRSQLLDYYATTNLTAETVTARLGIVRQVQVGTDEETGKPAYEWQPDVEYVAKQLEARRK